MECHLLSIVPGNSTRGGFARAAPRNSISSAINHWNRGACRCFRLLVPAIWMFALFLFTAGCGVDLSTPPVASSDPTDLTGTWVGTLEESDGGLYETEVVFDPQGQMSSFKVFNPLTDLTGTVKGLQGSNKFFKFTLSDGNEGGLVTDSTFTHAGIIINGFSAGVLQKTPPDVTTLGSRPYLMEHIAGVDDPGSIAWTGSIMRVEIDADGVIYNVIGKNSEVTISFDGTFTGSDQINGNIKNTTPSGNFLIDDSDLGRYIGVWEQVDPPNKFGPVVILITPDKNFLGSYSCVGIIRALDNCDFHLWQK